MVVFGWLDSQALFSSMSNLRLDGYIYTVESMRAAYGLLNEDGTLSLSFAAVYRWLALKLIRMVAEGTGRTPVVYEGGGQVIISVTRGAPAPPPAQHGRFVRSASLEAGDLSQVQPPRDDWPFLYLSGRGIPADYLVVIAVLLAICLPAVYAIRGRAFRTPDVHFLFLGLGFMLLETKSIGDCSLYFGATWFVTLIVVTGVLVMVLAANFAAMRVVQPRAWIYVPLLVSLVVLYAVDRNTILALSFGARVLWSIGIMPLPLFFAGLIFSTTFRESGDPAPLLGANLIGAMIGGFCEYLGMATGTGTLMLVVIAAYLISFACRLPRSRAAATSAGS
jgi:hypothetical protein